MKHSRILIALLIITGIIFLQSKIVTAQDKASKIDNLIAAYHDQGNFNGSVLIADKGNVLLKKGYGLANIEWSIPNSPDTKFRLGSITKQFTSMLIMQLIEKGKIELQDKITDYLKEYRKDTGDRITIHHLLTHTSGIPSYTGLPGFFRDISRDPYPVDEFIETYCSDDLEFEPGSRYRYNNSGYFLLGAIIEEVTEKSYETVLKENILDPVGMKNTGYDRHSLILLKRATGYNVTLDGYENSEYLDMSLPYAAGALYSTVEDMLLWDEALYAYNLLSKKYTAIMFDEHQPIGNAFYAYGWITRKNEEYGREISHGGGINGFNTLIVRMVRDKHLIVLFNNTPGANLAGMAGKIRDILHDKSVEMPKSSLSKILYNKMKSEGIDETISYFNDLKESHPDTYDFNERSLNRFGYQLLGSNHIDEAIAIFILNTEEFPESANVYDSLGEAYATKGEKELAIQNYAKSLQLNPGNTGAIEALKNLTAEK